MTEPDTPGPPQSALGTLEKPVRIDTQPGRQRAFLEHSADIVFYGGAAGGGKSYGLLLDPILKGRVRVPGFRALFLRRTMPQITNPGSLWDESIRLYSIAGGEPRPASHDWTWPGGVKLSFRGIEHESDVMNYKGAQVALLAFDQVEEFSETQFFYMLSRARSVCGVRPYIRATANPEPGWLAEFLSFWIAPDGYADADKIGKTRYMVRKGGAILWADSEAEATRRYGADAAPKSVSFIAASVYDNRILIERDPAYLATLQALNPTDRDRLLGDKSRGGNWRTRPPGSIFSRERFAMIDTEPAGGQAVRFWDMAATDATAGGDPDYSVGLKMKTGGGIYTVENVIRFRKNSGDTDRIIRQTAQADGKAVSVVIEQEPGSAGKKVVAYIRDVLLPDFHVRGVSATGSKVARARPVAGQVESGNVRLLRGAWNSAFLDEVSSFGEKCLHDDQVDALAGAYNALQTAGAVPRVATFGR